MIKLDATNNSCENCLTTSCFIKKYCSDKYLKLLSSLKETSVYKENQYIAQEGNQVLGLFFIQKGKAKVVSSGLNGKSQVVRLTQEGDIIGHRGYGGEKYPISAVAIQESVVCFIDNDTIYDTFMNNPEMTYELMMYYSKELRKSESKIKNQTQMNVREKVADALIYCDLLFNTNDIYPFPIHLNRRDFADLAGINREQLSRILSEFRKDEIISIEKNEILIVNINSLKSITAPFGVVDYI